MRRQKSEHMVLWELPLVPSHRRCNKMASAFWAVLCSVGFHRKEWRKLESDEIRFSFLKD